MYYSIVINNMAPNKKLKISISIKKKVWNKYKIFTNYPEITQCCTCDSIVAIPQSIKKYYTQNIHQLEIYTNNLKKNINGTAEFGHIISEKNGGSINEDNLIIQCKTCNTKQFTKNIDNDTINSRDSEMIDTEETIYIYNNIFKSSKNMLCNHNIKNNKTCKNKCLFNRDKCHIHTIN